MEERRKEFAARSDERRDNAGKRGYNYRWNKARVVYLAAHPLCVMCGGPATEVDHIIPHKGDMRLFWNTKNWQALCHECHSRKTYSEVRNKKNPVKAGVIDADMGIFFIP